MRTKDAVTQADGVWVTFTAVLVLYALLGAALVITLLAMARRWRAEDEEDVEVPYGPSPPSRRRGPGGAAGEHGRRRRLGAVDGLTAYAVFGGADFGAGLSLSSPSRRTRQARARADRLGDRPGVGSQPRVADLRPRRAVDGVPGRVRGDLLHAVHTAQPRRARHRAAGAGFAFHKTARRLKGRRLAERLFGVSSLLTPFFMGTVVGAVASGRVPTGNAAGDPVTSWLDSRC